MQQNYRIDKNKNRIGMRIQNIFKKDVYVRIF